MLLVFLQANTVFSQVFRLPVLVHHFLEHEENTPISFFDFLDIHYANQVDHPDDEHNDHQNLPFKTQSIPLFYSKILYPTYFTLDLPGPKETVHDFGFAVFDHYLSVDYKNIWQPPRFN
jgi:hypothetical protein